MFRSIKVSVTLGAAVLIALPGCCLPNLLCNHSSPSEEVISSGYSNQYVSEYSAISADCGCQCSAVDNGETAFENSFETGQEANATVDSSMSSVVTPSPAETSGAIVEGNNEKVLDVVQPPAELKKPTELDLPGNFLP